MYPIFFSVSERDRSFVENVWKDFPDDWVYLYSKVGRYGEHMWDEIGLEELPKAKLFVVFWSQHFSASDGCIKEIKQASELYLSGLIRPVIIRLDNYPLFWKDGMGVDLKPVFKALKPLADYRASESDASVQRAKSMILSLAEPLLQSSHPRMPRHDHVKALRQTLPKDRFTLVPACWVSGFNGVGRESLIRDLMRDMVPNGTGIVIEINESTLPRQLRLRIESEAFGANQEQLRQINESTDEGDVNEVTKAIERVFQAGNYLILRHGRIVQEEVELPEWLDDIASALKVGTRPKLFIISQQPLTGERHVKCRDFMVPFRLATVDEHQLAEFCYPLIGHFDRNPTRWTDEDVHRIVGVCGGTVGFLVSLVRSAARMENFDHIDRMLAHESDRMAEAITVYVRWAFSQLREHPDDQKTLLFLNDVSPCHILDLETAVGAKESMLRVMGRLIDLGLVERETEDLYRLTPLLANRLNRDLIRPELIRWVEGAHREFAKKPFAVSAESVEDGHEFIRLEAKIQAALLSGFETLPNSLSCFVSAAHWFQAGIRLYHARKWKHAYRLLEKAHKQRAQFRDASRIEIDRYFCLVATRMRKYPQSEDCIKKLNLDHRSKAIAAFLQADLYEYRGDFDKAIAAYESALALNKVKSRRQEFIYRALVRCILSTWNPDFSLAERYSKTSINLKRSVFSLASLARVYLKWKYKGPQVGREVPDNIDVLYRSALEDLEKDPGAGSVPFELYAEEAEFTGNVSKAIENMDQAIRMDGDRFQLRAARWRLMVKLSDRDLVQQALRELDAARQASEFEAIWPSYVYSLAETYVRGLFAAGQSVTLVNGFAPELQQSGELGQIIARVRRERNW